MGLVSSPNRVSRNHQSQVGACLLLDPPETKLRLVSCSTHQRPSWGLSLVRTTRRRSRSFFSCQNHPRLIPRSTVSTVDETPVRRSLPIRLLYSSVRRSSEQSTLRQARGVVSSTHPPAGERTRCQQARKTGLFRTNKP